MSNQSKGSATSSEKSEQWALAWVLAINTAQAAIVGGLGWWAQSTGLMGSALDNLGDAGVYAISLFVVGRGLAAKVQVARLSGILLMVFAGLLLFEVGRRFFTGSDPIGPVMIAVAIASALTNMICMWFLNSHREGGVHLQASWIFTTNDMLVNSAIALSGLAVILFNSPYPDLIIGLGVVLSLSEAAWKFLKRPGKLERKLINMISSRALSAAFLTLAVLISPAVGHDFQAGSITINHPWSRATPPVAPVAGGYLTLTNDGGMADRLVSISSPLSERAEIHESTVIDGVASMRPVQNGIEIGAGKTVELQPGGIHIMFLKPSRPLKEGERFAATLVFEQAGTIDVEFAVQNMGARPEFANEHDGHGEAVQ